MKESYSETAAWKDLDRPSGAGATYCHGFPGLSPLSHPNEQESLVGDPGVADFGLGYSRSVPPGRGRRA